MSALRISTPTGLRLVDLGPGIAKGHVHDGGRLAGQFVLGESGADIDAGAYDRVKRFRERHQGRKASA